MTPTFSQTTQQGVTLIETLVIVLIVGILAAISTPSFLSAFNSRKIDDVTAQVEGALREAQSTSIQQSIGCTLSLNSANAMITSIPTSCLPTGPRDLSKLGLAVLSKNNSGVLMGTANFGGANEIQFSQKGTLSIGGPGSTGMIVLYSNDGASQRNRCIAIASGIGLIRTGVYNGTTPQNPTDTNNCDTSP
jgi:Tfp pilus assembly protein FimT